ncbi:MAG TPA: hypothetical protein VNS33_04560 [Bradyrhizobium sp.]|nr:hypothetical protein [Bradyrhizobium sp.]
MRKLILISALLLVSASAHAGEQLKGLVVADSDRPAASDTAQPLPPVAESEKPKQQASEPARPLASRPSRRTQAERYEAERFEAKRFEAKRFEGNEAKARRIAAKYGISW